MLTPANPSTARQTVQNSLAPPVQPALRTATLTEVADRLRAARRVLAFCHIHPDGDAIGSLLALGWLLKALPQPPAVVLACADPVPPVLHFLPGVSDIVTLPPDDVAWDLVVSLDASDPARLGSIYRPESYGAAPLMVLDHHITNLYFGALNYVDDRAAATAQILLRLADELAAPVGDEAALCLMTGIVTDTLAFRTSNVTAEVLAAGSRLAALGVNIPAIVQRTLSDLPLAILRVWGHALRELRLEDGVAWTVVTQAMRTAAGLAGDEDGKLVSQIINAVEARAAILFSEQAGGMIEVDLRARPGYNVAQVALHLGGGGHPAAAGCTLPGTWQEVRDRVLPLVTAAVRGPAE